MDSRTERVPARRVLRGDDGAPLDEDRVLALALRWADRPLTLDHVKPGVSRAPIDGVTVRWEGNLPVIALDGGARAWVERASKWVDGGRRVALELGEVLVVQSGELTLEARLQRRSEKAGPGQGRGEGRFFGLVVAHTLMVSAAVAVALVITPQVADESMWGAPQSARRLSATPWMPTPQRKATPDLEAKVNETLSRAQQRQASAPSLTVKRSAADVLRLLMGGGGGGVFKGAMGAGIDAALSRLGQGGQAMAGDGLAGMGNRDLGGGIGGDGLSLGGPIGPGQGPGGGLPDGLRGGHRSAPIVCANCKPELTPGYDRDLVLKVVRRHQNEIRFCYESELTKSPDLAGKVTVAWTIGASGAVEVAEIAESGLSNANVEACIVQKVRRWTFPEPSGGQQVAITFPWVFQVAGAED